MSALLVSVPIPGVLHPGDSDDIRLLGGKGAALAVLSAAGLPVPA